MRYTRGLLWGASVLVSLLVVACSQAEFSGSARRKSEVAAEPPPPGGQPPAGLPPGGLSLALTCGETQGGAAVKELSAKPGQQAVVQGELCPTAVGKAKILFIVDFSGSMGRHRDDDGSPITSGNDPETAGSCGRLEAAKAVLAQAQNAGSADVQVGFIPFASDVLANRVVPFEPLSAFASQLDAAHFCSYVVQGPEYGYEPQNPGGIDGGAVAATTNYAAAFGAAGQFLAGAAGDAVAYFISDGEPTTGGADPVRAGIAAGRQFLQNAAGVTLNGLLLGSGGAQATNVLEAVVGAADHVRVAAQAGQLAQEIVRFPSVDLVAGSARAILAISGGGETPVALTAFGKKDGSAGVWSFTTAPFAVTTGDVPVDQVLTVTAQAASGAAVMARATLRAARL